MERKYNYNTKIYDNIILNNNTCLNSVGNSNCPILTDNKIEESLSAYLIQNNITLHTFHYYNLNLILNYLNYNDWQIKNMYWGYTADLELLIKYESNNIIYMLIIGNEKDDIQYNQIIKDNSLYRKGLHLNSFGIEKLINLFVNGEYIEMNDIENDERNIESNNPLLQLHDFLKKKQNIKLFSWKYVSYQYLPTEKYIFSYIFSCYIKLPNGKYDKIDINFYFDCDLNLISYDIDLNLISHDINDVLDFENLLKILIKNLISIEYEIDYDKYDSKLENRWNTYFTKEIKINNNENDCFVQNSIIKNKFILLDNNKYPELNLDDIIIDYYINPYFVE